MRDEYKHGICVSYRWVRIVIVGPCAINLVRVALKITFSEIFLVYVNDNNPVVAS
jgi:hypothetical protein